MHQDLRALLIAWRDTPGGDTSAAAARGLVAAGLLPEGEPVGGPEDAALWLDVIDGAPAPWSTAVLRAIEGAAGEGPELGAAFDASGARVDAALAEAVRREAGAVDLADAVLAAIDPAALPEGWMAGLLDAALAPEAQAIASRRVADDPVLRAELGRHAEVGRRLREAVQLEAGDGAGLWSRVAPPIGFADPESVPGWDGELLGEALRAEAGTVDIADAVMARVRRDAEAPVPDEPRPVGQGWLFALVAMSAAAAALTVFGPGLGGGVGPDPAFVERPVEFASAGELALEEARYGEHASVFVELPDVPDAPVIIWVDDGARL